MNNSAGEYASHRKIHGYRSRVQAIAEEFCRSSRFPSASLLGVEKIFEPETPVGIEPNEALLRKAKPFVALSRRTVGQRTRFKASR